jgi:phosphoribosylaminoimidazole-succinocarboxamide synthase
MGVPCMTSTRPFRKGKVKDVYMFGNELEFHYTDKISVFDKIIPTLIPDKGETLCRTSAYWFERLHDLGIGSHYLGLKAPNVMRVKKVHIISDCSKINKNTKNYLIPLEFICRHYVAGSMHDRIKRGKVEASDLGFPSGHVPRYGEKLPRPYFEVTTKLETYDRPLTMEEALKMSGMTEKEMEDTKGAIVKIDEFIAKQILPRGLIHVDGKKEFAFDEKRNLMVIDSFGTADEDRFWEMSTFEKGEFLELSKESVRQYYRKTGFLEILEKARADGKKEPDIPALPDDLVKSTRELYIQVFERLTGRPFRK